MKNLFIILIVTVMMASCGNQRGKPQSVTAGVKENADTNAVIIAEDIVTEVILKPDPDGDPWEVEKVAGYNGDIFVNSIFSRVYDGSLQVYDYHTGEPLTTRDVKELEREFDNDRSKIGKLSFTEDWYYDPATNTVTKVIKSVVFGYELYNNEGRVYAYKAAFKADLGR